MNDQPSLQHNGAGWHITCSAQGAKNTFSKLWSNVFFQKRWQILLRAITWINSTTSKRSKSCFKNSSLSQEALSRVHLEVETPDVWIITSMLNFHICVDNFIAFSDVCFLYVWSIWYISKSMHPPHEKFLSKCLFSVNIFACLILPGELGMHSIDAMHFPPAAL